MKWLYEFFPAGDYEIKDSEKQELCYGYAIKKLLFSGRSEFQQIDIIDNPTYGRALFLDNLMMTTEKDEFIYHELLSHVPAVRVKNPETALIIGGGDGGIARELCKYPTMKEITVAEIDKMVIDVSVKYLPSISKAFNDPRVRVEICDGAEYLEKQPDKSFDLIIVDSTEPIGPGVALYKEKFYRNCSLKLKDHGHFAAQGLAPLVHAQSQKLMSTYLGSCFKWVKPYMGVIPTYPTSLWLFFHASNKQVDIHGVDTKNLPKDTKYLSSDLLTSCYSVPSFVEKQLQS